VLMMSIDDAPIYSERAFLAGRHCNGSAGAELRHEPFASDDAGDDRVRVSRRQRGDVCGRVRRARQWERHRGVLHQHGVALPSGASGRWPGSVPLMGLSAFTPARPPS
jgi:hypothetical protein